MKTAPRVLLIDDEVTFLEYLGKRLEREGFSVVKADSGEKALEMASSQTFDVAIVDLKMPGIDGVETQRRLKEIQPFMECIVLTGPRSIQTALESGRHRAYQYLLKPAEYEELVKNIKEAHALSIKSGQEKFDKRLQELFKGRTASQGPENGGHGAQELLGTSRRIGTHVAVLLPKASLLGKAFPTLLCP